MAVAYNNYDSDFNSWLKRIVIAGETPSKTIVSAVGTFVFTLKQQGVWSKLNEVYILSGLTNFNSLFQKLKYIDNPLLTNTGFTSSNYIATGQYAGLASDGSSARYIDTNVGYNKLTAGNRGVGVYETKRANSFYGTLIGRERGGGNSAFGPTVVDTSLLSQFRFLDTTVTNSLVISSTTAAGLFAAIESGGLGIGRASKTTSSISFTPGTISGTGNYFMSYALGGGGFPASTISFGFLSSGLTVSELAILDLAVNAMMTTFSCNVY